MPYAIQEIVLKLEGQVGLSERPRIVMGLVYISFPLYVMATKPFAGGSARGQTEQLGGFGSRAFGASGA